MAHKTLRERMLAGDDSLAWEQGVRLGYGELAKRETIADAARYWFLRAIERRGADRTSRSCELMTELRQHVFGAFQAIFRNATSMEEIPGRRAEFDRVATEWAERWNLCREHKAIEKGTWTYEVVLETVHYWRWFPDLLRPDEFAKTRGERGRRIMDHAGIRRFKASPGTTEKPDLEFETVDQLRSRMEFLIRDAERRGKHKGLEPVPTKREMVHFDWLVRAQIEQHKNEDIACTPPHAVGAKAVEDANGKLRDLIDLPPNKGGRPRRPKTS